MVAVGATWSHIPKVNASERVQMPQKVTNSIVSSSPRKRGDLWVLGTRFERRRLQIQGPEPLASLKESTEETQLEAENAPKAATQPEVEIALKDPILKMEILKIATFYVLYLCSRA